MPKSGSAANDDAPEKMADHVFSPQARRDLIEIWEYIARDDVEAADRVEKEVFQAISKLVTNPDLGHLRRDLTSKPVRFFPIYSYLIIYNPNTHPLRGSSDTQWVP